MHTGFFLLLLSSLCFFLSYIGIIFRPRMIAPRIAALGGVAFIAGSFASLVIACVGRDYSFSYVYENVSNDISFLYRFSASWAGQEGSLLLWSAISGLSCAPLVLRGRGRSMSIMPLFLFLMTVSIITFANPFRVADVVHSDGRGLNILLLNPWMAIHPPVLFSGYACALPLFASAFAALTKKSWNGMIVPARVYGLLSASLILAGIFTGGIWAYETLGWGGFWGWDPVENGAFVPFLLSVAFALRIDSGNDSLRDARAGMLVSCAVYVSVMLSAFMTRSGIFADSSVHSFSESSLGIPFGIMSLCALGIPFGAIWYARKYSSHEPLPVSVRDRIFAGLLSFIVLYAAVIFAITALPVVAGIATGAHYLLRENMFNDLSLPIAAVFLSAIGISRIISISRASSLILVAGGSVSVAVSLAVIVLSGGGPWLSVLAVCAVTACAACVIHLVKKEWTAFPGFLLYAGFSVFVIGVIASSQGPSARIELRRGMPVSWRGVTYEYAGMTAGKEQAFVIRMNASGSERGGAIPCIRTSDGGSAARSPLIFRTPLKDYYISAEGYIAADDMAHTPRPGEKKEEENKDALQWETLVLNVSLKPMMILVWCGMIMSAAGLVWALLSGRRLR